MKVLLPAPWDDGYLDCSNACRKRLGAMHYLHCKFIIIHEPFVGTPHRMWPAAAWDMLGFLRMANPVVQSDAGQCP
eukprot:9120547-Pyramimonas_sp.AAC.1